MKLLEHNVKPAEECIRYLNEGMSVCYVSGVGTGKTYVFFYLAGRIDGKILYVYPKHSIRENINTYKDFEEYRDRVTFATYNYFIREQDLSGYSLIVIDECHHLVSDVYGRNLCKSLQSKVVGLTATPITSSGDCRDLFDVVVYGLSNFEAIESGLMSPYNYHLCIKELSDSIVRRMTFDTVRTCLDIKSSIPMAREIIEQCSVDKWIVFFKDIKQLEQYEADVTELFYDFKVMQITSDNRDAAGLINIANNTPKVVILSCTMFTEGIHLSKFEGIVIFRNIRTVSLFQQVLGRISYIGNSSNITVIDYSDCAYKLLGKLVRIGKDSNESDCSDVHRVKRVIKVSINDMKDIDISDLLELFHEQNRGVFYRGISYKSIEDLCDKLDVNFKSYLELKHRYKLGVCETINMLLSYCNVMPYGDSYL